MKRLLLPVAPLALFVLLFSDALAAFCGFYVARADAKLFNRASQVVLVRDGDRTVLTMANDFRGDPKEFAVVIPVPSVLKREQIHVGDKALIDHLDAYSAPRLVEYFDENPCERREFDRLSSLKSGAVPMPAASLAERRRDQALGVKVEATYVVGEYDIQILSATQSGGLVTWLKAEGYRLPAGATEVLGSYIRQNLKFFVAKVNLTEQTRLGFTYLRPLQVAYESPKFMLPVRLGTVNADGPQDLVVYALTRTGSRRDDELPDGEAADRHAVAGLCEAGVPCVLPCDVRPAGARARHARGLSRVRMGHGVVRPVRGRSAVHVAAAGAGRVLARRRTGRVVRNRGGGPTSS